MELNAQMSSEVELGYLANRHFLSLFPVHGINPHNSSTPQYPFAHYPIRAVSRSVLVVVVVVVRSRVYFFRFSFRFPLLSCSLFVFTRTHFFLSLSFYFVFSPLMLQD